MPLDLNCPKCQHVFPVTEARHPVGVQCPGCDSELTAEFRKRPTPITPGQPPYELLVAPGRPANSPATAGKSMQLRLEDEEEEGGKRRGGGSVMVVVLAGVGALLIALGGLGTTGYFLFTNLDTSDATINNLNNNNGGTNSGGGTTPSGIPRPGPKTGGGPKIGGSRPGR
jgi:hypothetical protein